MKTAIKPFAFGVLVSIATFLMFVPSAYTQRVLSHEASSGVATDSGCGEQSSGLQLCISKAESKLRIEFRNLSPKPVELSLGFKLGNREEHLHVKLLAEVGDKEHVLGDCFSIHGRSYPWTVRIPGGGTYSSTINLKHYCWPEINAPHWLTVEYTRTSAENEYWSGTVRSGRWWID